MEAQTAEDDQQISRKEALRVIKANDNDMAAHKAYLQKMRDKNAEKCVWDGDKN